MINGIVRLIVLNREIKEFCAENFAPISQNSHSKFQVCLIKPPIYEGTIKIIRWNGFCNKFKLIMHTPAKEKFKIGLMQVLIVPVLFLISVFNVLAQDDEPV
jgi:hypothetical protein